MQRIGTCGTLPVSITVRDLRLERRGFLNMFSAEADGIPYRIEFMERGSCVAVLPVDFARREVYLIRAPRPVQAFARNGSAAHRIPDALALGSDTSKTEVPGDEINLWEVPAGMIEADDATEAVCAARELLEEVSLSIPAEDLVPLGPTILSGGASTELAYLFIGVVQERPERVTPAGDGTERIEVWRMGFDELRTLLRSDVVTATARLLALSLLLWLAEGNRSPIPALPNQK